MNGRYVTQAVMRQLDTQLTERDEAIIRRVSGLRFVSGAQLARLHYAGTGARAARRGLARLVGLGLLARLPRQVGGVRAGSAGYVYRLDMAGQRLSVMRGWQADRRRRSHVPGTLFVAHALQVAELHTLLVEAERARRCELLELQSEPACWRSYGPRPSVLKPDTYVRLGVGQYEDSYFVEVDMGSEGSRALETKLKQYLAYQDSGEEQAGRGVIPKTVWLVPGAGRRRIVEGVIKRLPRPDRELFGVAQFREFAQLSPHLCTTGDLPVHGKMEAGLITRKEVK